MNAFVTEATRSSLAGAAYANDFIPNASAPVAPVLENEIDVLATAWQQAKKAEDYAKKRRYEIESQLVELVGTKDEGTTSASGTVFKCKTVAKLTRKLDDAGLQRDWNKLPDEIKKCIKWKPDVDTAALRSLESMRDDLVPVIAQYMTTKPAKPSIKVEAI